jgi:transposase-like protein
MNRDRYTDAQRAEAVELYRTDGPTVVQHQLGIPKGTVTKWAQAAGVETVSTANTRAAVEAISVLRERKREEVRTLLIEKAADMLGRMDEPHKDFRGKDVTEVTFEKAPSGACQQYATAAAILIDKFRLEMGESTARVESVDRAQVEAEVGQLLKLVPRAS